MLAAYSSKAKGHSIYYIAGDDHSLGTTTTKEVVETHYPGVPWTPVSESKYEGLVSCAKAKKELGWSPKYTWRSYSDGKAEMP
jgi:UDP-glucose 4-epimerase